jgi:protein-S-isoprenylcysteine O-methyltransferase Ste14
MAYQDRQSPSLGSKLMLVSLTLLGVIFSTTFLYANDKVDSTCCILLFFCSSVFYIRLVVCLFLFVKRKVSWVEGCAVGTLYGFLIYMFSFWGSLHSNSSFTIEITGVLFFIFGSFINSLSDYQRYIWKKKPQNKERIYTQGLFKYAMHINFWGDTVMFIGYAFVTQNIMSFIPVAAIALNFVLIQIPQLDKYLLKQYGAEFIEYAGKTNKYIPFIY